MLCLLCVVVVLCVVVCCGVACWSLVWSLFCGIPYAGKEIGIDQKETGGINKRDGPINKNINRIHTTEWGCVLECAPPIGGVLVVYRCVS